MEVLIELLATYGLWVVFITVLLNQGGIPVPAWPPLVITSAQAVERHQSLGLVLLVATAAALIADALWYLGGRRHGARMMRLICRVSLSPDSCVSSTRALYGKWGAPSLVLAKFIPGFAAVGTTLAGHERTPFARFALFDMLGAALWAGLAIALGALFHDAVSEALETLESLGHVGLGLVAMALVLFVGRRFRRRQQFLRELRMERISVDELYQQLAGADRPLVVDVRPDRSRRATGWIPGALLVAQVAELATNGTQDVIVYCDCPNEASAARVARQLKAVGFRRVRPLAGGLDAWSARGLPVEGRTPPALSAISG